MTRRICSKAALLLALGAIACGTSADLAPWASGSGPDFCGATREHDSEPMTIQLSREPDQSGIIMHGPAFADFDPDSVHPDVQLLIENGPVGATVEAALFQGQQGLAFLFNPRRLLRRHPEGFRVEVRRDGATIYRTEVGPQAAQAIRELVACDRNLLLGRDHQAP